MAIKSLQSGELTLTANTDNATITSVDLTKAFLIVTWRTDAATAFREAGVNARLTTSTNIAFQVALNGASTTVIRWTVVEFDDPDFSVQRGDVTIAYDNLAVAISAIDLGRSVATASMAFNSSSFTSRAIVRASLTTTINLQLVKTSTSNTRTSWQVIQSTSTYRVKAGTITIVATTANATITAVVLARTMLWNTGSAAGNDPTTSGWMYRATITTTTNVNAERFTDIPDNLVIQFYALEMPVGNTVQIGEISFGAGDANLTATITSVDTTRAAIWARSALNTGGEAEDSVGDPDEVLFAQAFVDSTTIRIRRTNAGEVLDVPWQVVEFAAAGPIVGSVAGTTTAVGALIGHGKMVASAAGATVAAGVFVGVGQLEGDVPGSTIANGILIGRGQMVTSVEGSSGGTTVVAGILTRVAVEFGLVAVFDVGLQRVFVQDVGKL